MTLVDLLKALGDENYGLQALDACALSLDWSAKKGTKITFATDVKLGADGTEKLGLIVWIDRQRAKEILETKEPNT